MMDSKSYKWLDSGTFKALHESSDFIMKTQFINKKQIALLDEIALLNGFIDKDRLKRNLPNLSEDLQEYLITNYLKS